MPRALGRGGGDRVQGCEKRDEWLRKEQMVEKIPGVLSREMPAECERRDTRHRERVGIRVCAKGAYCWEKSSFFRRIYKYPRWCVRTSVDTCDTRVYVWMHTRRTPFRARGSIL